MAGRTREDGDPGITRPIVTLASFSVVLVVLGLFQRFAVHKWAGWLFVGMGVVFLLSLPAFIAMAHTPQATARRITRSGQRPPQERT